MGNPSTIYQLPPDVREWLDAEIVRNKFTRYAETAEALAERGYRVSKSTLHRYGFALREQVDAFTGLGLPALEPTPEMLAVAVAIARVEIHRELLKRRLAELVDQSSR